MKDLIINKSAFPFYTDYWQQYFSRLSGEQCKEVLRIVCQFNQSGEQEKHDDFGVDMVANSIITNVVRDAKKRERRILASRENGGKGGRPAKPRRNPEKPKETQLVNDGLQFESFWNLYNKKTSRADAEKKFKAALKKESFENIIAGVERYTKTRGTDSKFWKNPSTWLYQECWKDEYTNIPENKPAPKNPVKEFNTFIGEEFANRILEDSEGVKIFLRSPAYILQINSDSDLKNKIGSYFKNKKWELLCQ